MLKRIIKKIVGRLGYDIINKAARATPVQSADPQQNYILSKSSLTYAYDLLFTTHNCDFINEPRFRESYELGKATDVNKSVLFHTEIYWRVHVLCWAASQATHLEGDFVDCGVNTGIFARAVINYIDFDKYNKKYFLLDTFTGLDERYSSEEELNSELNHNYHKQQDTLYNQVVETFQDYNVEIIQGAVPDTLPRITASKIAYLSIDMNCAAPEAAALEYCWDKIVAGGIIILDDYGYNNHYTQQKNAHDNFAKAKNIEILTLPTGQGMIVKPFN